MKYRDSLLQLTFPFGKVVFWPSDHCVKAVIFTNRYFQIVKETKMPLKLNKKMFYHSLQPGLTKNGDGVLMFLITFSCPDERSLSVILYTKCASENLQIYTVKPVLSDHIKQDISGFSDRWLLIAAV